MPKKGFASIVLALENSLNEDITLHWHHDGVLKSLDIPSGNTTKTVNFDISKPGSFSPVEFAGFKTSNQEKVDLNGFESVLLTPTIDIVVTKIVISPKASESFILVNITNNKDVDAYAKWRQGDVEKVLLIPKQSTRLEEVRFYGRQASPISIGAVTNVNGVEQKVLMNGSAAIVLHPKKEREVTVLVIGIEIKALNLDFQNNVAGDVTLSWKIGNERNDLILRRGERKNLNLVLDEKNATAVFSAVIENEAVNLNSKKILQLVASSTKKSVHRVIATKEFRLDLEFQNNAVDDVVVKWNENGLHMKKEVAFKSTGYIAILTKGPMADQPISFQAILKESEFPILLNDKARLELKPSVKKRTTAVLLSSYRLEIVNQASSDAVVELKLGPDVEMLRIPFGRLKVTNVKFDTFVQSLRFSGYNAKTNQKVRFNNSLNYEVNKDSKLKNIRIVITDGKLISLLSLPFNHMY